MDNNFKPYIPADKVTTEMTPASVILGIVLAVVFGAANAYLGLKVGLTVSASIPVNLLLQVLSLPCLRSLSGQKKV